MARPGPRGRPRVGWLPLLAALLGILMLAITPSAALTTDPVQPPSPDQANRLRQLWSDPDWVRQVQPRIGVQAFLSNGGGVKGRSAETAHHVVVSVNGVDPDTKAPVQWPCGQVTMHAQAPGISLELEDGDVEREGFRTVELGSDPQSFMLNGLGHVSFTLPAKYQSMTEESMLPLLYVRMQFMPAGQWVVAHIDLHAQALLKNVEPQHFIAANPQLSEAIAFMASQATKHYMTELQHASVAESRKVRRYRRDNNLHRGEAVPDVKVPAHRLTVDLERHWISTYTVHEAEAPRVRLVRRDALAQAHSGTPVEEQAKDLLLQFEGSPDDAVARETGLASYKMYRTQISNHLVTADDEHHGLLGTVLTGVAHIWQAFISLIRRIGVGLFHLLERVKTVFNWTNILRASEFLSLYFRQMSTLGFNGIDIIDRRARESMEDWQNTTNFRYNEAIEWLGGTDITLQQIVNHQHAHNITNSTTHDKHVQNTYGPRRPVLPYNPLFHGPLSLLGGGATLGGAPGARTAVIGGTQSNSHWTTSADTGVDGHSAFIQDRLVNNLPNTQFSANRPRLMELLQKLGESVRDSLMSLFKTLRPSTWENTEYHKLMFQDSSWTHFPAMALGHMLNIMRWLEGKLVTAAETIREVLWPSAKIYYAISTYLVRSPIRIPFIQDLWEQKLGRGHTQLTLLDMLCLNGAIWGVGQYTLWFKDPPFTANDVEAFRSWTSPELMLYTWNEHPLTHLRGNHELRIHRLGLYDWFPRNCLFALGMLQTALQNYQMVTGGGSPKALTSKSYSGMIFNSITGVMFAISNYPFTQMSTNDPIKLAESLKNPDKRYLGMWNWGLYSGMNGLVRPLMPAWAMKFPFMATVNTIISGYPMMRWGLGINLTVSRQVDKHDPYRLAVVGTMWFNMFMSILNMCWPFVMAFLGDERIPRSLANKVSMGRDLLSQGSGLLRNNLMMAGPVIGLLSSSWQGSGGKGGLPSDDKKNAASASATASATATATVNASPSATASPAANADAAVNAAAAAAPTAATAAVVDDPAMSMSLAASIVPTAPAPSMAATTVSSPTPTTTMTAPAS